MVLLFNFSSVVNIHDLLKQYNQRSGRKIKITTLQKEIPTLYDSKIIESVPDDLIYWSSSMQNGISPGIRISRQRGAAIYSTGLITQIIYRDSIAYRTGNKPKSTLMMRNSLIMIKEKALLLELFFKGAEFEKVQADNYILYIHIYVMISELYHLVDIYPDFVTNIFPHPSAQKRIGKSLMHFILQFERDAEKAFFILQNDYQLTLDKIIKNINQRISDCKTISQLYSKASFN